MNVTMLKQRHLEIIDEISALASKMQGPCTARPVGLSGNQCTLEELKTLREAALKIQSLEDELDSVMRQLYSAS